MLNISLPSIQEMEFYLAGRKAKIASKFCLFLDDVSQQSSQESNLVTDLRRRPIFCFVLKYSIPRHSRGLCAVSQSEGLEPPNPPPTPLWKRPPAPLPARLRPGGDYAPEGRAYSSERG
jgi:hypothetical protein